MSSIKLSPLILFLILIAVLVISYIFGYKINEGFVSFEKSKASLDSVMIPGYSTKNSVYKLYDNLYFDQINANLIEVDSTAFNGNVDVTGNTISKIFVTPREGTTTQYDVKVNGTVIVPQNVELSKRTSAKSSYNSIHYETECKNTDKYYVAYIPFDDSTFVHILDKSPSTPTQIGTFLFGAGNTGNFNKMLVNVDGTNAPNIPISGIYNDVDNNNNNMVSEPMYSSTHSLYQIGKYVKYDLSNANLVIQTGDGATRKITIYDRNNNKTEVASLGSAPSNVSGVATVSNISNFSPYTIYDSAGQTMVLYMPIAKKTVVALIKYDASTKSFTLGNVCRFDNDAIVKGSTGERRTDARSEQRPPTDSDASEYYKWYWYWKTSGSNNNSGVSNDYMLKTQVVPPVCPSCPACNNASTCTNCGGKGGSGTLATGGGSMVTDVNAGGAISNISSDIAGTAKTGIVAGTVLAGGTVIGAGALAEEAGSGAASLARDTASGTASFIKDAASGTAGFVKDAASGTVGLAKDAVSGVIGLTKGDSNNNAEDNSSKSNNRDSAAAGPGTPMAVGTQNQYADQYSYYGTLPAKKTSNYMPITADFSKFGK